MPRTSNIDVVRVHDSILNISAFTEERLECEDRAEQ